MVEDVLTVIRRTEDEAEEMIRKAKEKASDILDKADNEARRIAFELETEGKTESEKMINKAKAEGEKQGEGIIDAERKKASKLEKDSEKNLEKGITLIVDSVLSIGGE